MGQSSASPILDLTSTDGLVGPQYKQLEQYKELINSIANSILTNLKKIS